MSGIASGALYAFRALNIPRQCLVLSELSGRLRASDMNVVASGSAIAIAELADKKLPNLPTDGWNIQSRLIGHHSLTSPEKSTDEIALSEIAQQFVDFLAASKLADRERLIAYFAKTVHHALDSVDKSAANLH